MRFLLLAISFFLAACALAAGPQELKLTISAESTTVSPPYPLQLTLLFSNAGTQTLWLYRPVRDWSDRNSEAFLTPDVEQTSPRATGGGSTLEVKLTSADPAPRAAAEASGAVLLPVGMPHPRLVRLAPGEEDEERVLVQFTPAAGAGDKAPASGDYKLVATYRARYSNADEIERVLGVDLWHLEAESNALLISVQPAKSIGAVSGTIADSNGEFSAGTLVSLSDRTERTIAEAVTNFSGQYQFDGLPWGFYWVTARPRGAPTDRTIFQHVVLSAGSPSATVNLMLLASAITEPKQFLHKPVLVRIDDGQGRAVSGVRLRSTFSSGNVVENVQRETGPDGLAEFELIPGSNFLSLKKPGCAEEDRRMEVSPGGGVDAFLFKWTCTKK